MLLVIGHPLVHRPCTFIRVNYNYQSANFFTLYLQKYPPPPMVFSHWSHFISAADSIIELGHSSDSFIDLIHAQEMKKSAVMQSCYVLYRAIWNDCKFVLKTELQMYIYIGLYKGLICIHMYLVFMSYLEPLPLVTDSPLSMVLILMSGFIPW